MTTVLHNLQANYDALCAERDRRNALNAPLQAALDEQNALVERHQLEARRLAARIEANWGGAEWVELKKQIGMLAKALSAPKPVETPKEPTSAGE